MSWKAWRSRACESLMPLTASIGTAVAFAVAIPVMEFVWPGAPVTMETPGDRVSLVHPSAICTAADSCRVS